MLKQNFEPWAPVKNQFLNILREVNRRRKKAGYELMPLDCLPMRRRQVRPFGNYIAEATASEAA